MDFIESTLKAKGNNQYEMPRQEQIGDVTGAFVKSPVLPHFRSVSVPRRTDMSHSRKSIIICKMLHIIVVDNKVIVN